MSSHNNVRMAFMQLHKIRKLTNSIDFKNRYSTLDSHNITQAVKLPTLNSINRSVKYGDVSFTFSRDLNKLRKEPQADELLSQELAQSSMLTVRRRYDSINRQRSHEQDKIKALEMQKTKYQLQKGKYQSQKSNAQNKVKNLEEELKKIKDLVEYSEMERRVMTCMSSRLKSDKVVFDQRKYNKQLEHNLMMKNRNMLIDEATKMKEQNDRVKKVYNKLVHHINAEENQRDIHVGSMQYMLGTKIDAVQGNRVKKQELKEVAEITLAQKDEKEKNWYKVYLCHKFMQKLLRDKMDREMLKFNSVQTAFKNIKTSTGVGTTQTLVSKYLKKQQEYGTMLSKISQQQKKIIKLKSESDILNKEYDKYKNEEETLNINKRQEFDLSKEEKEFNNVNQRSSRDYLLQETIKLWLFKNMKKFRVFGGDMEKIDMSGGKKEVVDKFIMYVKRLDQEIQKIGVIQEKIEGDEKVDPQLGVSGSNLRISLNPEQKQKVTEKLHHNLHHQLANTRLQTHSSVDQDDILNQMRDKMLKNNEKFMRQAHRRQEDLKKQRIEAQPKKKEPIPIKSQIQQTI